jgi:hypothetical protein
MLRGSRYIHFGLVLIRNLLVVFILGFDGAILEYLFEKEHLELVHLVVAIDF